MKNIKPESVIKLFRENRGKDLAKWGIEQYTVLKQLMYASIYKRRGVVYGVFNETNQLCAGAFFIKSKNRLIFLFSGSNAEARENHAMTFLIDMVIKEYASKQAILDFEGSNDENLSRFYKGFGAKEILYPGIQENKLSFPAKQVFDFYRKLRANNN